MDIALNMEFWSDVGLALAARLSLVLLVLWMMNKLIDARMGERAVSGTAASAPGSAPAPVNRLTARPHDSRNGREKPKVLTLRRPDGEKTPRSGDRERMRRQLMAYLEERTAGREK